MLGLRTLGTFPEGRARKVLVTWDVNFISCKANLPCKLLSLIRRRKASLQDLACGGLVCLILGGV